MSSKRQSVGYQMTVVKLGGRREPYHCLARSEHEARRKGLLRPGAQEIEDLVEITREEYWNGQGLTADPIVRESTLAERRALREEYETRGDPEDDLGEDIR